MHFRVYDATTDEDVTESREWFLDIDGFLWFETSENNDGLLELADDKYFYRLEILCDQG